MGLQMGSEEGFVGEASAALGTSKRLLAGVVPLVYDELRPTKKRFAALRARKRRAVVDRLVQSKLGL